MSKVDIGALPRDFRDTLHATGVGLWSFTVATREFYFDATSREIIDLLPDEELSPETLTSRIHPQDLEGYLASVREVMAGGEGAVEYRVVHRDGSVRHISSRGRLTRDADGRPLAVTGVCLDVTLHRELERELQETQARMQRLADNVPGLFAYLDRDLVIRFLSAQYDEWYGFPRERNLGRHISECIADDAWEKRRSYYERCLAGEIIAYEEARRMADGQERYYTVTYQPATDSEGRVTGILSLAIDITARREAERRLEGQSRELERSNSDLEQFAYVASHDLKAPLRAIEILVDWLREDLAGHDGGDVRQNLELLRQRTGRLHRLLDDLLAYSRAGRSNGDPADVDTRLMVEDLATLLAPPEGIRICADPSLPPMATWQAPLEQVLRNLINNAVKHHPGPEGQVRVYAEDRGDAVIFAVEDDGTGIPQEYAEKVFQMFQTLKPRDEVEGSGMGLAIVRRIVEAQGGRIWFHGGPGGRGTVFKFTWHRQTRTGPGQSAREDHDERAQNRQHLAG